MSGILAATLYGNSTGSPLSGNFITAPRANVNIHADLIAAGWDGVSIITYALTIAAGVVIYSANTTLPALDTGGPYPVGSTISISNDGIIVGKGGLGAQGNGIAGAAGGPALKAQIATTLINRGTIGGGGGGGGGGGVSSYTSNQSTVSVDGGAGGGGIGFGQGGTHFTSIPNVIIGQSGTNGTATAPGIGGIGGRSTTNGGDGGAGGNYGAAGSSGTVSATAGGAGGAGGVAIIGNIFITTTNTGVIAGAIT
jgi:Phage tail fibre adhesin Gp38